jgi:SNF2 family DNA or RNA helicase
VHAQLAAMCERDPTAKALIFTQFKSTLRWLMQRLTAEGYGYRTISGSMAMKKRSKVCACMLLTRVADVVMI